MLKPMGLAVIPCTLAALSIVFAKADFAVADEPPDHHGDIVIEEVWATPSLRGGHSVLRLRLINDSQEHVHLLGIETPFATDAHIVGRIDDHQSTTFDSISVRANDDLDLTTSHLWIELGPLTRDISPGESIPVELVFLRSRLHVEAHVHSADG